jgi:hypothetical protein
VRTGDVAGFGLRHLTEPVAGRPPFLVVVKVWPSVAASA